MSVKKRETCSFFVVTAGPIYCIYMVPRDRYQLRTYLFSVGHLARENGRLKKKTGRSGPAFWRGLFARSVPESPRNKPPPFRGHRVNLCTYMDDRAFTKSRGGESASHDGTVSEGMKPPLHIHTYIHTYRALSVRRAPGVGRPKAI